METITPIEVDHELGQKIVDAATAGKSLRVKINNQEYVLTVSSGDPLADSGDASNRAPAESTGPKDDLWADYDPEKVRAAVRRARELGPPPTPEQMEKIEEYIAEVYSMREQAPRSWET